MTLPTSRREFLASSAAVFGGAWVLANFPAIEAMAALAREAQRNAEPFSTLTDAEARTFVAFAEQILPKDDTPGATDAGAVYFADRALDGFAKPMLPLIRTGLKLLDEEAKKASGGVQSFADLPTADQIKIMRVREQAEFFGLARTLVIFGVFADPSYGGNRDHTGERIYGIQHQPIYQPPFGYYDAEEANLKARGL
jgi:gluconate 2-dehydrogenase gamma chain